MLAELEQSNGIGILRLRRPERANALNTALLKQLERLQRQIRRDRHLRVLITLGEGKGFCAGSDVQELAGFSLLQAEKSQLLAAKVCREFLQIPQPTIAGVHGYALGGGFFLAAYHDFRIVSLDARLGLPEVALGWNPTFGIQRLCQLAGVGASSRWLMLGSEFSASEAAESGWTNQVVPESEVLTACNNLAERLLALPAGGLTAIKQAMWGVSGGQFTHSDAIEARLFRKCLAFSEAQASLRTFRRGRTQ
ncbi:MAG: enoyl-CoA hydratase/isomerase family protein [Terriglobales bacterium]